jgi:hypothetical protein
MKYLAELIKAHKTHIEVYCTGNCVADFIGIESIKYLTTVDSFESTIDSEVINCIYPSEKSYFTVNCEDKEMIVS